MLLTKTRGDAQNIKSTSNQKVASSKEAMSPTISPSSKENIKWNRFPSIPLLKKSRRKAKTVEELMDSVACGTTNLSPSRDSLKSSVLKLDLNDDCFLSGLDDSSRSIRTVTTTGSDSPYRESPRVSSVLSLRSSLMESMNDTNCASLKLSISGLSLDCGSNTRSTRNERSDGDISPLVSPQVVRHHSVELSKSRSERSPINSRRRHSIHSRSAAASLESGRTVGRSGSVRRRRSVYSKSTASSNSELSENSSGRLAARSRPRRSSCTAQSRWNVRNLDNNQTPSDTATRRRRVDVTPKRPRRKLSIPTERNSSKRGHSPLRTPRRKPSILVLPSTEEDTLNLSPLGSPRNNQERFVEDFCDGIGKLPCPTDTGNSTSPASKKPAPSRRSLSEATKSIMKSEDKGQQRRRHTVTFASESSFGQSIESMLPLRVEKPKGYIASFVGAGAKPSAKSDEEEADSTDESFSITSLEEKNHAVHKRTGLAVDDTGLPVDDMGSQPNLRLQDLESEGLFIW